GEGFGRFVLAVQDKTQQIQRVIRLGTTPYVIAQGSFGLLILLQMDKTLAFEKVRPPWRPGKQPPPCRRALRQMNSLPCGSPPWRARSPSRSGRSFRGGE